MKKFLTATILFVALSLTALAGGKDKDLIKNLNNAFKSESQMTWSYTSTHKYGSFIFNGKKVAAYLDRDTDDLTGFCITINTEDLPQETKNVLNKKYAGWAVEETVLFVSPAGHTDYFAKVKKDKQQLALKLDGKRIFIFSRM